MKYLIFILPLFLLIQCAKTQEKVTISILKDSLYHNNDFIYLNEVQVIAKDSILAQKIYKSIIEISENAANVVAGPYQRLEEKKKILAECFLSDNIIPSSYVCENYEILSVNKRFLSFKYQYNQRGNYSLYEKYFLINTHNGERLKTSTLYNNVDSLVSFYNEKYKQELKNEISLSSTDEVVVDVLNDYLINFNGFNSKDLENIELVSNEDNEIVKIRFHYNGLSGYYKSIWPQGFLEFDINSLKPYLRKDIFFNK